VSQKPAPDWWDDELDRLMKQCVAVFGEDATDDIVVRLTERHCAEIDVEDIPVREALVPSWSTLSRRSCGGC
jgi:hypothetical protein